jgi:hypothetical protein
MKKTFTYTTAEGKIETRTSVRTYTHVIVGRLDHNKERASVIARRASMAKQDRKNYRYWSTCATTAVDAMYPGENFPVTQDLHDKGLEVVAEHPTAKQYVAARADARYAAIPAGDLGPELVLQWCTSERSARQAVETHSRFHSDVRVVALP